MAEKPAPQNRVSNGDFRFRPDERLHSSGEYQSARRIAKRFRTPHFGVNVSVNGIGHHRLGLVVQKRFFDAVRRNRIKRCLREWFRLHKQEIPPPGKDIVIVARSGAERLKTGEISLELQEVLTRRGTERND